MCENTENTKDKLIQVAFEQLMENVRKQDELVHSWTKYYLSIQAGLVVALSFLMRYGPSEGSFLPIAGSLFIPFLGGVTAHRLTNIILREKMWQGRYIYQISKLPEVPETYRKEWVPTESNSKKWGYIGDQLHWLRITLIMGWTIWFLLSLGQIVLLK